MADLGRTYHVDEIFDPSLYPSDEIEDFEDCDEIEVAPQSNLEVARSLAKAGLYVHPCNTNKAPTIPWGNDADRRGVGSSCTPSVVDTWWRVQRDAIPGVNTGKCRLIVVDCDRHGGQADGVTAFWDLAARHGGVPEGCPIVSTPSGGLHVYFALPDGFIHGNGTGSLPPGIDVRSIGGQTIAPGATLPDGRRWQRAEGAPDLAASFAAGTIPVLPKWLADIIRAPKQRDDQQPQEPRQRPTPAMGENNERLRAWALAALEGVAGDLAGCGKGGRNTALNNFSMRLGSMAARGLLTKHEVFSALWASGLTNGMVGEDGRRQFSATFESGFNAGLRNPCNLPEREIEDDAELLEIGRQFAEAIERKAGAANAEREKIAEEKAGNAKEPAVEIVVASSFAGKPVPPQEWHVEGLIPAHNVTMLAGDGATGKSLLALQLTVATATGCSWIGLHTKPGKALFISAEDEGQGQRLQAKGPVLGAC